MKKPPFQAAFVLFIDDIQDALAFFFVKLDVNTVIFQNGWVIEI